MRSVEMGGVNLQNQARNASRTTFPPFYFFLCLYLLLLGWGPLLQNVAGLATLRVDEMLLPIIFTGFIILPVLLEKRLLPAVPKAFIYTWGIYLAFTFLAILGQNLTLGQESWVPFAYLARLALLTVVFYLIYTFLRWRHEYAPKVMNLFVVISLGIGLLGILQWFGVGPIRDFILQHYPRITTFIPGVATSVFGGNPTILATFLLIPISFVFAQILILNNKGKRKIFLYGALAVLIFCLFLTVAKMAILSLPVLLFMLSGLVIKRRLRVLVFIVFFVGTIFYLVNAFAPHVFVRFDVAWAGSVQVRLVTWAHLWEQISAGVPTLMFGHGFMDRAGAITESQYFFELFYKGALGLIGYLLFLFGSLIHFLKLYLRTPKDSYEKALYLGTCGMLFAMTMVGFTYTTIQPERISEWIFILLAIAYASTVKHRAVHGRES